MYKSTLDQWIFISYQTRKFASVPKHDHLCDEFRRGEAFFEEWLIDRFVEFALDNAIIDTNKISYSITDDAYILATTAIKPAKHACYRNFLINYAAISLLPDARYRVNKALDRVMKTPERQRKISEKQLLAQLEAQREQGERGELFVMEYELKRISDPERQSMIQRISTIDVAAGFDIVSCNSDESVRPDRFIEVKTYKGEEHFIWSDNERDKASVMGDSYFLYLVDDDCIGKDGYEPVIIRNPVKVIFDSGRWLVEPDSYRISKLSSL